MVNKKIFQKRIVLLDSHAIIHRAYHALPEFVSSQGEPTGGLYGLATMLIRIIGEWRPDYVVACYDLPEPTFRKQIYENYKAGRQKADDDLVAQIIRSQDLFKAFNIPIYSMPGFEADDILGTLVEQLKNEKDLQIVIASGDMDTLQLVKDGRVIVYTLKRGLSDTITYDEAAVEKRFGFGPTLLPDWKGLRGDPSDNIIGVRGIGEKTATTLVTKFGSLEEMYSRLRKDPGAFAEAGITPRLLNLLKDNEEEAFFSKTLATIRRDAPIKFVWPEKIWREGVDLNQVEKFFAELDFRTLGARFKASLANQGEPQVAEEETPTAEQKNTLPVPADLAIAVWLLNSDLTEPSWSDVWALAKTKAPTEAKAKLLEQITAKNLNQVYFEIELPLVPIIAQMEERGILVDRARLENLAAEYHQRLKKLEEEIYRLVGNEFNLNSPKQLGEVLFDQLNLTAKGLKKTAGGARSTRESELLKLKDAHPAVEKILAYRELQKLVSTYLDAIPKLLDGQNRLHTKLHQTGTTTGRMSSSEPNLQNIPADEVHGDKIRAAFVASPGYDWLSFDYSQIEMRVLALLSGDEELTRIFASGVDVHTAVAARVFRVAESEVTREMRRRAKVINFGIIYGMGVSALQKNLNSTRAEAQEFYDGYFAAFPKIHGYFEQVKSEARLRGYTETYFGRRRYFSGIKSRLPYIKAMNERMAMNAPLQGTAADLVKIAMRRIDDEIRARGWEKQVYLLLQVHDELIFEAKTEIVDAVAPVIQKIMENIITSAVPLKVAMARGRNWGEAE